VAGHLREARRPATLTRAAAATYAVNAGAALLSLLSVLVVARSLGPAGRGELAFLIAVAMLSSHLVSLSLQEANANLAASEPDSRPALASNSVLAALALGSLAAVLVGALTHVLPALGGSVPRTLLWLALACVPLALLKQYLTLLVQADYGFTVTNASWLAGPATTVLVNSGLALAGAISVESAFAAWAGGQALGLVLLCGYVARHAGFGRPNAALARRQASFGIRAHVGRLMEVGNYRGDQWLLGATVGSHELGLYSIAVAWAELLFHLPGVLVLVQRPDLVRASAGHAVERVARVCRAGLVLAGAASVTLILAAPALCTGVFGPDFAGSIDDLRVLALGACGIVVFELLVNALTAQRRPLLGSAATGVAFVLTVSLDVLLIPPFGGVGAAVATTIAYTGGGIAAALIFRRALGAPLGELRPRRADVTWLRHKLVRVVR
jgi:O-antigen/teichoic acid export membrane protein